jgi:hypothetical protein
MSQENTKTPGNPDAAHTGEPDPESLRRNAFWAPTTIDQLAAEQGVSLPQDIDSLIGQGADLWEDDEDFDRFLAGIAERRKNPPGLAP